jgi:hypothetical protein
MGLPSNIIGIMGKNKYLPLTTAWIAATSETDTTILNALNTFEAGLIANSLTTKFNAIYPFVGGNSTKHAYNFINTATYQLTFTGGWTHASTGALPNGTNAYANTGLIPSSVLTLNNAHFSAYLRTNTNAGVDVGCAIPGFTSQLAGRLTGIYIGNIHQTLNSTVANASSTGHYLASRTGATTNTGYKNGASILASTVVSTTRPSVNVYLSARNNNGTADNFSARELALASIGSGLTAGEVSTLYTLIQAFQTSLSRQV